MQMLTCLLLEQALRPGGMTEMGRFFALVL